MVREAVRKALKNKPLEFGNKELMLKYAKSLIKKKFNYDINKLFNESKLLKNIKEQSKLTKFI